MVQTISNFTQLDEKLAECDRAERVSDDAIRRVFASFRMDDPTGAPHDPLSDEYRRFQLNLYEQLAGKPYRVQNEETAFDIESAVRRPFPYHTGSAVTTGEHLYAMGALMRRIDLAPPGRVLEFGAGWGNTTMALASLGFQVTAVDIEERFCELLRRRATLLGVEVLRTDVSQPGGDGLRGPLPEVRRRRARPHRPRRKQPADVSCRLKRAVSSSRVRSGS